MTDDLTPLVPTAENLHLFNRTLLKKSRTAFTPDVILLTGPTGERYVLKDFSRKPLWIRVLWCRGALRRETRAYKKLEGIAGIPKLIVRLSPDSFIMEFLDSRPLPSRKSVGIISPRFFEELDAIVEQMHGLGVIHGDLRRQNLLLRADGGPCLLDFETAITRGEATWRHCAFDSLANVDRITVLKLKARYFPKLITDEEKQILDAAPWHLRLGRFLRQNIYGNLNPRKLKKRLRKRRKIAAKHKSPRREPRV